MRIIIENGKLKIKGSQAERKAWAVVQTSLREVAEYGGGPLGDKAVECLRSTETFLEALQPVAEWSPERVKTAATA